MSAEQLTIFALGARLGMTAPTIEAMSHREVVGWLRFFGLSGEASANDGAVPFEQLSREQLRVMFPS